MRRVLIRGGRAVFEDGTRPADLLLEEGRIADTDYRGAPPEGCAVIDAAGQYVLPGFVEIHAHGGGGFDFMDATEEAFHGVVSTHLRRGTTSIMPTTCACSPASQSRLFGLYRRMKAGKLGGALMGVHMEGPYIAQAMKGAQNPRFIRSPEPAEVDALMEEAGDIVRLITAAPELPGMEYLARAARRRGIVMSSGHSDAVYAEIDRAHAWGFSHITHMYSNTPTIRKVNQRVVAGVLEFAWLHDDVDVELIGDGRHVAREALLLALKIKGPERVNICSDAMRAAGTDVTESYLGEKLPENRVIIEDGVAKLPDRSFYAGSIATGDVMLRWLAKECGVPLHAASRMLSLTPARIVGAQQTKGSLARGKDADLVLVDEKLIVKGVILGGRSVL